MARQTEPERIIVRHRVDVSLSAKEVEHAIRRWVANQLAPVIVPSPKSFSDVIISFSTGDDGALYGATASYEPDPTRARPRESEEG